MAKEFERSIFKELNYMEEVKNIIESFSPLLESYELKRKEITNRLNEVKDACKQALKEKIQSILTNKTNCFKTEFGAICVKDIVEIRTYDECLSPVVIFDGFYIRGTKDENNNVLYERTLVVFLIVKALYVAKRDREEL